MKAGIVVDDWKLLVFRKRLEEAGYEYTDGGGPLVDTTLLLVETDNLLALKEVLEKCQAECRETPGAKGCLPLGLNRYGHAKHHGADIEHRLPARAIGEVMSEILERAAAAVAIASDSETAGASIGQKPFVQDRHRAIARAVLEAIRTPTDDMVRAGEAWLNHCSDVDSLFTEMMNVALYGPK